MTDRQPEPTTEAGRLHIKHWHPVGRGTSAGIGTDGLVIITDLDLAESILAIEAAARADYVQVDEAGLRASRHGRAEYERGRADERERLAEAVRALGKSGNGMDRGNPSQWYVRYLDVLALLQPDTASES